MLFCRDLHEPCNRMVLRHILLDYARTTHDGEAVTGSCLPARSFDCFGPHTPAFSREQELSDGRSNYCDGASNFFSASLAFVSFGLSSNAFLKLFKAQSLSPAVLQASPKLS